jgi:high-affinity nickel-transport protein
VYPLGFLFGLGFDTATEVGLLAISATAAQNSISVIGILSLPLLFAAGMSLMDTADGMFMTTAYRWAFSTPIRKMYYNIAVTSVSVTSALVIGAVELIQLLADKFDWSYGFIGWIRNLDFGDLGYILAGLFVFAWVVSITVWKAFREEKRLTI